MGDFLPHNLSDTGNSMLRRAVDVEPERVLAGDDLVPSHTVDVDDMSLQTRLFHLEERLPAAHGQTKDVGVNHSLPILGIPL